MLRPAFDIRSKWRAFMCSSAGDVPMNTITLRFLDGGLEAGFASGRVGKVIAKFRLCSLCIVAVCCATFLMEFFGAFGAPRGVEETQVNRVVFGTILGILCLALGALVLFSALQRVAPPVDPTVIELVAVLVIVIGLVAHTFAVRWYAAYAMGIDPRSVFDCGTDTTLLLAIDSVVTVTFLVIPIRFQNSLLVPVVGVLVYVVPTFALGGPDMVAAPQNSCFLLVLTVMAALGKRDLEQQERALFATVLREKSLRFQSEFELSRRASPPQRAAASDHESLPESHKESLPSTANTDRAFMAHAGSAGIFERLAPIGEKEQWLISKAEISLAQGVVLGEGGFGRVHLGEYQGFLVAVKVAKDVGSVSSTSDAIQISNELRILRRLRHPNIVVFYGACIDNERSAVSLVLELVKGVSLGAFINPQGGVRDSPTELDRAHTLTGVSAALRYMHSRTPPVAHGDLKDSNLFVERVCARLPPTAKLLDFGLSRVLTRHSKPFGGTPRWAAPEVFKGGPPRCSADVFSFGRLIFFIATGRLPWSEMDTDRVRSMARRQGAGQALDWPASGGWLVDRCRPAVAECCKKEPCQRPAIEQLHLQASHWLQEVKQRLDAGEESSGSQRACGAESPACTCTSPNATKPLCLLAPGLPRTPQHTVQALLLDAALSINVESPVDACCPMHRALVGLRGALNAAESGPCMAINVMGTIPKQCASCGVLSRQEGRDSCFFCDSSLGSEQVSNRPSMSDVIAI